jgi:hypothetical protein
MTEKTTPQPDKQPGDSELSRRDLFRTAGLVAGNAMLLGLPKFVGGLSTEVQAAERPSFSTGTLFLEPDGQPAGLIRFRGRQRRLRFCTCASPWSRWNSAQASGACSIRRHCDSGAAWRRVEAAHRLDY